MAAWRFSIRELFLLTTAAAAVLALTLVLIDRRLPVPGSALASNFGAPSQVSTAAQTVSPDSAVVGSWVDADRHGRAFSCEYAYVINLAPAQQGQLMGVLEADARGMLTKQGFAIEAGSSGTSNLHGFTLWYEGHSRRGFVVARRLNVGPEKMELSILIYEHDERP
jgi:hypothetical protein